ncbi:MAG: GntR family transcriptional regulator [Acidimicrobiia bacterium]
MVAAYLRGLIFDGTLPPGSRIPQDEVAEVFGLSRIPVREALAMLATEGRVTIELHRGAFVNVMDERSVYEAMDLMDLLIEFVVRRTVDHKDPALMDQLASARRRLQSARTAAEVDEATATARELVFRGGTSARVFAALSHVLTLSPPNMCQAFPGLHKYYKRAYIEMIKAIEAGDADRAVQAMRDTAAEANRIVLGGLRARGVVIDDR